MMWLLETNLLTPERTYINKACIYLLVNQERVESYPVYMTATSILK